MIDNDPSKSISSIASDMEVSKSLMRQVMCEDFGYFTYKKGPIFITGKEAQEKKPCCKAFEETRASPPTVPALVFLR